MVLKNTLERETTAKMATALSNGNDAGGLRERPARSKEQQFSGLTTPSILGRALSNASR